MSLTMSLESPRSSAFTFESTVHSSHVLRCLEDQRRRDVLCDVTVVVEGQSFRAHRSVLASCSEYFTHRVSSHTGQGLVLTLPLEVTVNGFEPLLQFAYTSKLLFSKENVIEIRNCATVLGFRDLDKACFDFILPKFFSSSRSTAPFQRKTCCKKRCKKQPPKADHDKDADKDLLIGEKGVKVVSDSSSTHEVGGAFCPSSQPANDDTGGGSPALPSEADVQSDVQIDYSFQCPKYRKFQLACGKEACGPNKGLESTAAMKEDGCPLPLPCSSGRGCMEDPAVEVPTRPKTPPTKADSVGGVGVDERKREEDEGKGERIYDCKGKEESAAGVSRLGYVPLCVERSSGRPVCSGETPGCGEGSTGVPSHCCSLEAFGEGHQNPGTVGERLHIVGGKGDQGPADSDAAVDSHPKAVDEQGGDERSGVKREMEMDRVMEKGGIERGGREGNSIEKEVAGHLAKGLWSDPSSPPPTQEAVPGTEAGDGSGTNQGSSPTSDWLKLQLDLDSSTGACPFLQDLDTGRPTSGDAQLPGCEGASQSGKSPCMSSVNSAEDGDSDSFDTEGDSESYTSERAREVPLPFSVDRIAGLSRNDFQQMQHSLTREQLDFVQDVRRRSKNRIAAQRCRKRKLDCIHNLECEINKLRTEKEKLMSERNQLNQMKVKSWHSVSVLYQRICSEAALSPEQLQILAKYTSQDCPLSALISPTDSVSTEFGELPQAQASLLACSQGPARDVCRTPLDPLPSSSRKMPSGEERLGDWTASQVHSCTQVTYAPPTEECEPRTSTDAVSLETFSKLIIHK